MNLRSPLPKLPSVHPRLRLPLALALFAIGLLACGALAMELRFHPGGLVAYAPLSGLAAGVVAQVARSRRAPYLAVVAAAGVAVHLAEGRSWAAAAVLAIGYVLEAAGFAWLLDRFLPGKERRPLRRNAVLLIAAAAFVVTSAAGVLVAVGLYGLGDTTPSLVEAWLVRSGSAMSGMLSLAPAVLVAPTLRRRWSRPVLAEVTAVGFALLVLIEVSFQGGAFSLRLFPYLPMAIALLAPLRLGAPGAAVLGLVLAPLAGWQTAQGDGPFATSGTAFQQVIAVQFYVAVGCLGAWLVATLMTERQAAREELMLERDRARALVSSMQDGLMMVSPQGELVEVNRRFCEMTGFTREELVGLRGPRPYWPDEDRGQIAEVFAGVLESGHGEFDLTFQHRDGRRFPVILTAAPLRENGGGITGYVETVKDISERRRAERALNRLVLEQDAAAEHRALSRLARAVAAEVEPERVYSLAAEESAQLLGAHVGIVTRFEESENVVLGAYGVDGWRALGDSFSAAERGVLAAVRRTGRPAREEHFRMLDPTLPGVRWALDNGVEAKVAAPIEVAGGTWGALAVAVKQGECLSPRAEARLARFAELVSLAIASAASRSQLATMAMSDPLTGLANHRAFHDRLAAESERARRHGRPLSLIVLDLDHFKRVNDTYGHPVGDQVLIEAADRLRSLARAGDTLGRVGGEEFAWLLPETDVASAMRAAERARAAIGTEPIEPAGTVTLSAGICDLSTAETGEQLYRRADLALYWAKAQGRNICLRYSHDTIAELVARDGEAEPRRRRKLGSLRALVVALDVHDHHTELHSERAAELAGRLAEELGWAPERAALLREAALVHDVGKIGVPHQVLSKPARLTEPEYELVKEHAALGARILDGVLSPEQVTWVRHHHERWDGTGYPDRLAGDEVPDGARLIAAADAWDAMTSARPYRPAKRTRDALAEIRSARGAQFAPEAVDVLERLALSGALRPGKGGRPRAASTLLASARREL